MSADPDRRKALWLLAAATVVAAVGVFLLVRDRPPRLTTQTLSAARQRWRQTGPRAYQIRVRTSVEGLAPQRLSIEVRDGRPEAVELEGATPGSLNDYTVDGLFATLEREIELRDSGQTPNTGYQTYLFARFDPELGYPTLFRRLVGGAGGQAEIQVLEFRSLTP